MAIGPIGRGLGRVFRFTPGPQQMPLPGMTELPGLSRQVFSQNQRVLPSRASRPLPPLPEDIATRRPFFSEPLELPRTETLPFEVEDPVTGVRSTASVRLTQPTEYQTEELLRVAENDLTLAAGIVLNSLKTTDNPKDLYQHLVQLRALRERYGAQTTVTTPSRVTRGPQSTSDIGGQTFDLEGARTSVGSLIPEDIEAAIDAEIWRAAARSGIPESEIGKVTDSLGQGMEGLRVSAREKERYETVYAGIGKIASKAKKNPEVAAKAMKEIEDFIDSKILMGGFTPMQLERLLAQSDYWLGRLKTQVGELFDPFVDLQKRLAEGVDEGSAAVLFKQAISQMNNEDELRSMSSMARTYLKSDLLIDDVEADAVERLGEVVARRARTREPVRSNPLGGTQMPRSRPTLTLRDRPLQNPYGRDMQRALPFSFQQENDWKWFGTSHKYFGPGKNYKSFETVDPESGELVHRLLRWNKNKQKWEQVDVSNARTPRGAIVRAPEIDPLTGKFVRDPEDYVEFQGFSQRIPRTVAPNLEFDSADLVRESIELLAQRNGVPRTQSAKVVREVLSVVKKLEDEGAIQPGGTQYNWMTSVFGRIALNVSGPGTRTVKTKRGRTLVSRDRNEARRKASIIALEKAEAAGFVPEEAAAYIRKVVSEIEATS